MQRADWPQLRDSAINTATVAATAIAPSAESTTDVAAALSAAAHVTAALAATHAAAPPVAALANCTSPAIFTESMS